MKILLKSFFFLLSVFFLTTSCNSGKELQGYSADNMPERLDSTLLWELRGKGIRKPSYIFGTIHMISEKDFLMTETTTASLKKTKKLVMEIDLSQMMATSMKMLSMAPMQDNKKLKDLLSEEDYNIVKTFFTEEAENPELKMMPFEMIENWKPMLLQSFLYKDMIEGPVKAYEMEFLTLGQSNDMEFGGLETIEDQIGVFEKIPYTEQAEALVEMIKDMKAGKNTGQNEFEKLVKVYKLQDIDGMVEMSGEQMEEMGEEAADALLNNRNENWIPLILDMAKEGPTFFAVGAAHLGGESGVIRLLMKEGYTLIPVKKID